MYTFECPPLPHSFYHSRCSLFCGAPPRPASDFNTLAPFPSFASLVGWIKNDGQGVLPLSGKARHSSVTDSRTICCDMASFNNITFTPYLLQSSKINVNSCPAFTTNVFGRGRHLPGGGHDVASLVLARPSSKGTAIRNFSLWQNGFNV